MSTRASRAETDSELSVGRRLVQSETGLGMCLSHGCRCMIVYWLDAEITQDASKVYVGG